MFTSARIKLTTWYVLLIIAISLLFSSIIYFSQASEIDRIYRAQRLRIERRLIEGGVQIERKNQINPVLIDEEYAWESKQHLVITLGAIDLLITIFSAILGYFLAGKTLKPIKTMLDDQNRFISDASHELRTPLTALKSSMEVFLRSKQPKITEARELIEQYLIEIERLQKLSEELLQLALFKKSFKEKTIETIEIKDIIQKSISQVDPIAKKKNIQIITKLTNAKIQTNVEDLQRVLIILLDNSIKYSDSKSSITITCEKLINQIKIQVIDHGVGIDQKDLPHIFERFYRSDLAREKLSQGGYGLGLSIAKEIVTMYNGSISVSSKPTVGSTFTVKLPLKISN